MRIISDARTAVRLATRLLASRRSRQTLARRLAATPGLAPAAPRSRCTSPTDR